MFMYLIMTLFLLKWLGLRTTTLLLDLRKSHAVTVTTVITVLQGMKALHRQ